MAILIGLILAGLACAPLGGHNKAATADEYIARLAKPSDIIGYWKLVPLPESIKNAINPWPLPYQYFAFYADGTYISAMMSDNSAITTSDLDEAKRVFGDKSPKYRFDGNKVIITNPQIPGYSEIWRIQYFIKNYEHGIQQGDLVMSLFMTPYKDPVVYRHLKKM